jgi:hypothetical protein
MANLIHSNQILYPLSGSFSGSLEGTSSYATTASYVQNAVSASYVLQAVSASYAQTASYILNAVSSSFASTASYVQTAQTASYVLQVVSASFASTVPSTGIIGDITRIATGSVTASVTPTGFTVVSGSMTEFSVTGTGVTIGSAITDIHQVTGSLNITGSLIITGSINNAALNASSTTNNVQIGTAVDAGFKLDVQGTTRINGATTVTGSTTIAGNTLMNVTSATPTVTNGALRIIHTATPSGSGTGGVLALGGNAAQLNQNFAVLAGRREDGTSDRGYFSIFTNGSGQSGASFVERIRVDSDGATFFNLSSNNQVQVVPVTIRATAGQTGNLLNFSSGSVIYSAFNATGSLMLGTSTFAGFKLDVSGSTRINGATTITGSLNITGSAAIVGSFNVGTALNVTASTNNVQIGTAVDAGFKLDVQGTTRINGATTVVGNTTITGSVAIAGSMLFSAGNGVTASSAATTALIGETGYFTHKRIASSGVMGFKINNLGGDNAFWRHNNGNGDIEFGGITAGGIQFYTVNIAISRFFSNGNLLIGSGSADNGFKLQVTPSISGSLWTSGSAVIIGNTTVTGSLILTGSLSMSLQTGTPVTTVTPNGYYSATINGAAVFIPFYV